MKHLSRIPFSFLLFAAAAAPALAVETYDTRTGEKPSWWQPRPEDPARAQARQTEAQAQRTKWLRTAPIGSHDFCATSVLVFQKKSETDDGGVMRCYLGETTAQELQANGWELTDERRSIHPHSLGFEVEVVNTVVIKRRCVDAATGSLRGPVSGKHGCAKDTGVSELRPSLFWQPHTGKPAAGPLATDGASQAGE